LKFYPVVSITFGLIFFFIFSIIFGFMIGTSEIFGIVYFLLYLVAGFIANFLAKERKVRYGFYEGICIIIFINLNTILTGGYMGLNFNNLILGSIIGILLATIGAILAIKIDKNNKIQ